MFVPSIPLVACFGEGEGSRTWTTEKPVIAIDDNGVPWVVASRPQRTLVPATKFDNYQALRQVSPDHSPLIIAAPVGWRAIYACVCREDDGRVEIELSTLPIAAWKQTEGTLIPLVPHSVNYGVAEGSARGRDFVGDPDNFGSERVIAIFGPGEELPPKEEFMKVAAEILAQELKDAGSISPDPST